MVKALIDRVFRSLLGQAFAALVIAAAFVVSLYVFFEPRWMTNDDVAMSMIAHGYGAERFGSPNLIFSNVLWGHLIRILPNINGFLGYSIATITVLIAIAWAILFGLSRLKAGYLTSLSILVLILTNPVLFPQFTINAGLLMVAAVISWNVFADRNIRWALIAGCFFAFFSYLVRREEFLLVFIVALPLIPWRTAWLQRDSRVAFMILIVALVGSMAMDHQAYQGEEWQAFKDLRSVLYLYTDFGASEHLKGRLDILARYGYTVNDLNLLKTFFVADPNIANPHAMQAMLDELGSLPMQQGSIEKGWAAIKTLQHINLLPLTLAALILAVLFPNRQTVIAWIFFISAIFGIGLLGRPAIIRVYVPLVSLLVVAPLLVDDFSPWRKRIGTGVVLVATVFNTYFVFLAYKSIDARIRNFGAEEIRSGLASPSYDPVITWGWAFPYEAVYPVLEDISSIANSHHFYSLGWNTLIPSSVASQQARSGLGLPEMLAKNGISIIATTQHFIYLNIYCRERFRGQLKQLYAQQFGAIMVRRIRCEIEP